MKEETRKTVEDLARVAIKDPAERDAVFEALRKKSERERKDRMISGKEAARLAGVDRKTIRRWEGKGYLHGRRITPYRIRFSRRELESFLGEVLEA